MSEEIHFLEDGYYVEKLEKEIQQLKEELKIKQDDLKCANEEINQLKEVIEEVREYIKGNPLFQFDYDVLGVTDKEPRKELLQILDKVGDINEKKN